MPTQRLIDINTAAITYRTKCLMALDKKMYRNCIGAIISLNAELPADDPDEPNKKYRIVIDTEQHYTAVKENYLIVCPSCVEEHPYHIINFFDIDLPKSVRIITGEFKERIWLCPKCNKENKLLKSKIIQSSLQKPYYLRTVPEPPKATHGLLSKLQFHQDMTDWVWLCLNAIEEGFTRFRDDNWNKKDEYDDLFDIDTSEEEAS